MYTESVLILKSSFCIFLKVEVIESLKAEHADGVQEESVPFENLVEVVSLTFSHESTDKLLEAIQFFEDTSKSHQRGS